VLQKDRETNRPRGFGFVTFASEGGISKVLESQYHDILERKVSLSAVCLTLCLKRKRLLYKLNTRVGPVTGQRRPFSGHNPSAQSCLQHLGVLKVIQLSQTMWRSRQSGLCHIAVKSHLRRERKIKGYC
jgi:hypothetical protein